MWLSSPFVKIRVKSTAAAPVTEAAQQGKKQSRISEHIRQEIHVFPKEAEQLSKEGEQGEPKNENEVDQLVFTQKLDKLVEFLSELYWREKENGVRNVSKAMVFVNTAERVRELKALLQNKERKAEMAGVEVCFPKILLSLSNFVLRS